ncbi:MAG: DUF4230 domain-containing protein [Chloroflexi bacterium]|nr:DUF4230 domain-containing protein [Chloroflexota bacterium]
MTHALAPTPAPTIIEPPTLAAAQQQPLTQPNAPQPSGTPPDPEQRRGCCGGGCLWILGAAGGCLLILITPLVVAALIGTGAVGSVFGWLGDLWAQINPPTTATVASSTTLVNSIHNMSELVTLEVQLAKANVSVDVWQGLFGGCRFIANHVAEANIRAGIDLTQLEEEDIRYDALRNQYTLTVPAPHLTSCFVAVERYADTLPMTCGADWEAVRRLATYTATHELREDAIEGGILERAERETSASLAQFVGTLLDANVEIVFEKPDEYVIDASCMPPLPAGWGYADNVWRLLQ